jgi:hypothetical protein
MAGLTEDVEINFPVSLLLGRKATVGKAFQDIVRVLRRIEILRKIERIFSTYKYPWGVFGENP